MQFMILINLALAFIGGFLTPRYLFKESRLRKPHYEITIPFAVVLSFAMYWASLAVGKFFPALIFAVLVVAAPVGVAFLADSFTKPGAARKGNRGTQATRTQARESVHARNQSCLDLFEHRKVAKCAWDLADETLGYLRFTMNGVYAYNPFQSQESKKEVLICEYERPLQSETELRTLSEQFCKQYNHQNITSDDAVWYLSKNIWHGGGGPYRLLLVYGKTNGEVVQQWFEFYRASIPDVDQYSENQGFDLVTYTFEDVII